jgi:hypothetical protein
MVTLTDYALTLECVAFAAAVGDRSFALFFTAAALAPLLGGTVHGFFPDEASLGQALLWRATMLAVGTGAALGTAIAGRLLGAPWLGRVAWGVFAAYALAVLAGATAFRWAVAIQLPAVALLLVAFARTARSRGQPRIALGACGLGVTLIGAALQQARVGLHPVHFDHNVLYHVVQAGGLLLLFLGARALVRQPS